MTIIYILGALLAFSLLVIIHELGHFILAKLNDVKVEEFSLGMGPKLFGIKKGETEYTVKALPIGGYVKMLGEDGEDTADNRSFTNKSSFQKLTIVAAGPIMNLILAIFLFGLIGGIRGFSVPVVDKVIDKGPAQIASIQKDDRILKVNDKKIITWEDFATQVYVNGNKPLNITYERNDKINTVEVKPVKQKEGKNYMVGVYAKYVDNPGVGEIIRYGFQQTNSLINQTFMFFKTLFAGKASANDFGGPLTIIKVSGEAAKAGILSLITFAAYLSVQLAIFNIIPFPALDGGWILLFLIEIITRKKIDKNKVGLINYIGFFLLMSLMVLVTVKDILYPIKF